MYVMKQFTLDLSKNVQRPVAKLTDWHQFNVMLDTGALFPVWVDEEDILLDLDAVCVKETVEFGGFGGNAKGKLYRLPYFKIGELVYPGLPVIAYQIELPCQMLLSSSMFSSKFTSIPLIALTVIKLHVPSAGIRF